ncbi:serine hydrolase [Phytoactinopolyspora endophytica]|uniref:serine hydrolase n=1 Tax=Phytoactinopolyspora endophytica TaxID=1642495 RepID=UPI00101BB4A4|nr:serine hydrolase [Phytoactinopolyspora endophytica]
MTGRDVNTETAWAEGRVTVLRRALESAATSTDGVWGFAVRERGETVVSVNGDVAMRAASTIKVPLLILALQDVAAGHRELSDVLVVPGERVGGAGVLRLMPSVRQLRLDETLELMIGVSDNNAANMVIDMLGVDDAAARITALGARSTHLGRRLYDVEAMRAGLDNVTTADDQALLLGLLGSTGLLPDDLRTIALDILGRQQFNDRIPAALGPDIVCRHKTGELAGVRHDVGILEFDGRSVVFTALGSGLTDPASQSGGTGVAGAVIATAARAVVDIARSDSDLLTQSDL